MRALLLALVLLAGCRTESGWGVSPYMEGSYVGIEEAEGGVATAGVQFLPPSDSSFRDEEAAQRMEDRALALAREAEQAGARADASDARAAEWAAYAAALEPPAPAGAPDAACEPASGDFAADASDDPTETPEPAGALGGGLPAPNAWERFAVQAAALFAALATWVGGRKTVQVVQERRKAKHPDG